MLKFRNEWSRLNEVAKGNRLSMEETILLFAIREVEDGKLNNEFNKQHVQNTSLGIQADAMAMQIQKGEYLYQQYLKGNLSFLPLEPNEEPISFVDFLSILMSQQGIKKDSKWVGDVKDKIKEITEEFEGEKNGNS